MTIFLVLIVAALVALAAKRYFAGHAWLPQLLRSHAKKEEEGERAKVDIVVEKNATTPSNSKQNNSSQSQAARKALLSKPPRYEGPRSPVRSVEVSVRAALNDLRSRQVVKNLCSKFEARVARHSLVRPESDDDDEEACIRAASPDGGDEYLQPGHAQQLRRDDTHAAIKPVPFTPRRNSNATAKPNNLNAFLRRYSSNLERANFGETCSASSSEPATPEVTPLDPTGAVAHYVAPAVPVPAPAQCLAEIDLLDLQPANDEASNQCDSPVRSSQPRGRIAQDADEEPADDSGFHHGDWDVTAAKDQQQQAPEECPPEYKSAVPVARFQQFQQQIPSNHARTSPHHATKRGKRTPRAAAAGEEATGYACDEPPSLCYVHVYRTYPLVFMASSVSVMRASSAEPGVTTVAADLQDPPIPKQRPEARGPMAAGGDTLVGKRLRKSFGSRFFWGAVVGCYYITEAKFYKIRFDDGDVDILTAAEVLEDVKQAEKFALEDKLLSSARTAASSQCPSHESPIYQDELRRMTLKRKRDEQLDPALYESVNVTVWEQRLYVSIITSNRVTTVSEFVKRSDGRPGEVEATGQVRVGDIISQINGHQVAGLDSASVSGMIKSARRPLVIVFLRPRASHQLQGRVSRAEDVLESEPRAETEAETVERSHRSSAAAASAAANAVHITNSSPTPDAQAVEATPSPAANALVSAPQSAAAAPSPAYPEDGQQSQPCKPPSYQAEHQSAPGHTYSNSTVVVPQQRYPQQQSQVYSGNQYMQQYPAAAAARAAVQSAYEALSDSHQSLRVNLVLKQQQRTGMPNQWNSAYGRQQAQATAYGTSMIPVPQPNSSYNPYLTGAHVSTSHLRPQYKALQAAHPQQFVASQHSSAMLQQHSQQQTQPIRTRWANGIIVGNFPPGGSGSSMYSSSSTAAPARTMAPEYSRSGIVDYQSTQQPAASVTAQGVMPAHQYATASSSSLSQQSRPEAADYYDSTAAESSGPSFSTSESRFSVVEPVQEQQNHSAGGAVGDDDDGTESDEPPDYDEPIGRFELEDDLDDKEKQLATDLGMDVAPASTGKAPSSSFLSASSVAADPAETEDASSFLSPNKPSFVAKLPQNIGNQYVSDIVPPSQHVESTLTTVDGEECVVVEIYRTRLYVTLGSLGTWIAITSFVRGKNGEIGEIEESGKVFIGDTIYAINGYPVNQEASPTDVARVVTNLPRPFKLYFQRATWDTLEGNT